MSRIGTILLLAVVIAFSYFSFYNQGAVTVNLWQGKAMELPVVGYRAGGVREMVGCDACFVRDKDALAALIVELLDDRKRRLELGRANRERALELFSVESDIMKSYP